MTEGLRRHGDREGKNEIRDEVSLSGVINSEALGMDTGHVRILLSGVSGFEARGWAAEQEIVVSGVSWYRARDLESLVTSVVVSGLATIRPL